MKINKLLIALTTLSITGFSQTITIRDISTREPLEKAVIQDKNNKQVFTDAKGNADISALNKGDSILIFSFGYSSKKSFVTTDATIYLSSKSVNLDEIVLSANRKSEHKIDVPYSMEIIKQKDIEFTNPATTGDLLLNTGQVFVQKSQAGGGSPSLRGFEANKVLYQGYKGYSYKHSGQDFIIWNSGSDWYYEGRILKDNLSERDYAKHYPTKKQAKQRAEEFIDDILSKKEKVTESIDPIIGTNVTFVAKHKEKGYGFGSGFTLSRKTVNNKFVSIIDCKAGTEVTGEVIGVYTMPVKMWKIKLDDGYYAMIDSDFFYIKP
jgi:hypothetical protein